MRTVTLSGWGQPHDALKAIAPDSVAVDYAHASSAEEALRMIAHVAGDTERVIGWSLGGQLAVRAVASGMLKPKQLVLIATPYQFVDDSVVGRETFAKFHDNYKANPKRTMHKAWELIHYEDERSAYIADQLAAFDQDAVIKKDWLRWLNLLADYSCELLDFSGFPPTLLVHGAADKVVDPAQSTRMAGSIKQSSLSVWLGCGHAPHFHDPARLQKLIEEHAHV